MKHTEATKRKMSALHSGAGNPFYGRRHTARTLRLIAAESRLRHGRTKRYKPGPRTIQIPEPGRLAYLAGLVDGEGSINIAHGQPRMLVYNTDVRLMRWLVNKIGGRATIADRRGRVPCWHWSIGGARNVLAFCEALAPTLIIKRGVARQTAGFIRKKYGWGNGEEHSD